MPTARSNNYYKSSHGRCKSTTICEHQHELDGITYCADNNGFRSDYCEFFLSITDSKLGLIINIDDLPLDRPYDAELKAYMKTVYNAVCVMSVWDKINHSVVVMYTTDECISKIYGTKQRYYTYAFITDVFKSELPEGKFIVW